MAEHFEYVGDCFDSEPVGFDDFQFGQQAGALVFVVDFFLVHLVLHLEIPNVVVCLLFTVDAVFDLCLHFLDGGVLAINQVNDEVVQSTLARLVVFLDYI